MPVSPSKPKAPPASNLAITKPTVLQLAALFGVTKGAIETWTKSGKLAPTGSTLAEHIAAFTVHKGGTGNGSGDLTREKIREAKARADKYEIQNARLLNELVPLADVENAIKAALMEARQNLLNLPNDIGQEVAPVTSVVECVEIVRARVYEAMTAIAETSVDDIVEQALKSADTANRDSVEREDDADT